VKGCDCWGGSRGLEPGDGVAEALFGLAELPLEAAEDFFVFAFGEEQIVIGELGVLLLEFAFDFVPGAVEFELGHGVGVVGRECRAGLFFTSDVVVEVIACFSIDSFVAGGCVNVMCFIGIDTVIADDDGLFFGLQREWWIVCCG
jgi:hypothetical protein